MAIKLKHFVQFINSSCSRPTLCLIKRDDRDGLNGEEDKDWVKYRWSNDKHGIIPAKFLRKSELISECDWDLEFGPAEAGRHPTIYSTAILDIKSNFLSSELGFAS